MTPKEFETIDKMYRVMSMLVRQYKADNSRTQNHSTICKEWKDVEDSIRELRRSFTPVTITAEQVRSLRESTGEGLMACKKALLAARGDIEKAERLLK